MKNPLVSVVIPVYNKEDYLCLCIDSVINQSYKNLEIICIDDKSTDKSLNILKNFAKTDNRIKIIENPKNIGVGKTRDLGIQNSNGTYTALVDADDFIENTFIETLLKFSKKAGGGGRYYPGLLL